MRRARLLGLCALLALAGCETLRPPPAPPPVPKPPPPKEVPAAKPSAAGLLRQAAWQELPEWQEENPALAWKPFLASCRALAKQEAWRGVCAAAENITEPGREQARRFFELNFMPYRVTRADGGEEGLITGYYEPLLKGSRTPSARYRHPVYGLPDDLLVVDLTDVYPELRGMRLRGRLDGRRIVPYYDRAQIDQGRGALAGREIVWVDDPIELFFLQIQGSGRIALDSGEILRVGYADQNGHPYRSIGRLLVELDELPLEKASMQGIKAWARANPGRVTELLNHNASYVFFRELPADLPGPLGALGVPLTARRSVAVDPGLVPLGAPVYIATTWPLSPRPLNRLMLAQDTGGAIRGAVRVDFFWGFGDEAAREAGRMRQPLRMWVLLPNAFRVPGSDNP
ncbi:MAG: MltA domain-containing protein [Betaproteobacteria bacterium]|nr:MltA domain-containing protein [Betaproteobacteria bacterium]